MKRSEKGSIVPLFGLIAAVALGAMVLLSFVTAELIHASQAQTAADAAALAGASRGEEAARIAATANRSKIIVYETSGPDTFVKTKSGRVTRSAQARKDGPVYALSHVNAE